ncbi:hypothetical protein RJ639_003968 [Escallonia herrerae]|uniref:Uncharacterized protein n=1 Tax=Escallonia herrerae TaxID=1293975 RepID=A0AA88W287_9ASTE|nr:hypothetical protein RJ639_003968 [Escallonia herrerae]
MSLRRLVPTLVISSAGMAKEVFKTNDLAFSGRPTFLGQQKLSYNGLDMAFSPYNDTPRECNPFAPFAKRRFPGWSPKYQNLLLLPSSPT